MLSEELKSKIYRFASEMLKGGTFADLSHSLRVWKLCEQIGKTENADLEVLYAAALLHDIAVPKYGVSCHYERGAQLAEEFLSQIGFPKEKVSRVISAIRAHSRYGGPEPSALEEKILYDADLLDCIGAVGIIRAVQRTPATPEEYPSIIEKQLENAEKGLQTQTAKKIAAEKIAFTRSFINQLKKELEEGVKP